MRTVYDWRSRIGGWRQRIVRSANWPLATKSAPLVDGEFLQKLNRLSLVVYHFNPSTLND